MSVQTKHSLVKYYKVLSAKYYYKSTRHRKIFRHLTRYDKNNCNQFVSFYLKSTCNSFVLYPVVMFI